MIDLHKIPLSVMVITLLGMSPQTIFSQSEFRINSGGDDYTDGQSNTWQSGQGFYNTGLSYATSSAISGTTEDYLYQTERWDPSPAPEMLYSVPTGPGRFLVRLGFAELFHNFEGERVFDVFAEDQPRLFNFDILSEVPKYEVLVKEFEVVVEDDSLDILFAHKTGNPKVNTIEVLPVEPEGPLLEVSPHSLDFGAVAAGGEPESATLELLSSGSEAVSVTSIQLLTGSGAFTLEGFESGEIPVSETRSVEIHFSPVSSGNVTGSVEIASNAPDSPLLITLSGSGFIPPKLAITPESIDFGSLPRGSASPLIEAAVTNIDSISQELTSLYLTGDATAFSATESIALPVVLAPSETVSVLVSFEPETTGNFTASLGFEFDSEALSAELTLTGEGIEPSGEEVIVHLINTGGSAFTDSAANQWQSDEFFNTGLTYTTSNTIAQTEEDSLYQSERYDSSASPDLVYSLPVEPGFHRVRLHFAEIFPGAAAQGARVFDVLIEGQNVLDDFDIFASVGLYSATASDFLVQAQDSFLDIEFQRVQNNPKISAIEVFRIASPEPLLTVSRESINFSPVEPGISAGPVEISMGNAGALNLEISSIVVSGSGFSLSATPPYTIAPADTRSFDVDFIPPAEGTFTGEVVIESNDPNGTALVSLSGQGVYPASVTVNPLNVDFGQVEVGQQSADQLVEISNTGNGPVELTSAELLEGTSGGFDYTLPGSLPLSIDSGASEWISIIFSPDYSGTAERNLSLEFDGGNIAHQVTLQGEGYQSPPDEQALYRVNAGGGDYEDTQGKSWSGDAGYVNTGIPYSGSTSIAGTADQALYQSERWDPPDSPEMLYSFPADPGLYRVRLHFAEIYSGANFTGGRVFDVLAEGQTILDDYDIFLAAGGFATAVTEEFEVSVSDNTLELEFLHEVQNPKISAIEILTTSEPAGQLAVSPASLDLGSAVVPGGSATALLTISNTGGADLSVTDMLIQGSGAADFSHAATPPFTLDPGTSQDVMVQFSPSSLGVKTAELLITSDDPAGDKILPLSGTGIEPVIVSVEPQSHDFGLVAVNTSSPPVLFTVTNTDTADHTMMMIELLNNDSLAFSLSSQPSMPLTLAPQESTSVEVSFAPASAGVQSATIKFHFDNHVYHAYAPLTGEGQPQAEVVYRVNAGGGNYTDSGGNLWEADNYYNTGFSFSETWQIEDTEEDALYRTERWDNSPLPELRYTFPADAGSYRVRLHFAEIFQQANTVGKRVFDVKVEDETVLSNFDIYSHVGFATPLVEEVIAQVDDGQLNIDFIHKVNHPKISAIEIIRMPVMELDPDLIAWGHIPLDEAGGTKVVYLNNTSAVPLSISSIGFLVNQGSAEDFSFELGGQVYPGGEDGSEQSVSITIPAGGFEPLYVDFDPTVEQSNDFWLEIKGNFTPVRLRVQGTGGVDTGHPFLHVTIIVPPYIVDYDGNGSEPVQLIGSDSHTHEFGHELTAFEWEENNTVFSTEPDLVHSFPLGEHTISLTIYDDNDPPETLTDSKPFSVVEPESVPGALVRYYLSGEGSPVALLDSVPAHADFGARPTSMLVEENNGKIGPAPFEGTLMVQMEAQLDIQQSATYDFQTAGGMDNRLFINGSLYSGPLFLQAGRHSIEARFAIGALDDLPVEVQYSIDGGAYEQIPPEIITHDESQMEPIVNTAPAEGLDAGGFPVQITGLGFFPPDQTVIHWGSEDISQPDLLAAPEILEFTAPAGQGLISFNVETPNGLSRTLDFFYSNTGPAPVRFDKRTLANPVSPTQMTWGADGRLYVASVTGQITAYGFDDNYQVIDIQEIDAISNLTNSNILGIATNPFDPPGVVRLYAGHGHLFANGGACFDGVSEYSGQVSVLTGPDFDEVEELITGLPVSNHDHSVNGLDFDNNGDLLIAVGSNTNAGVIDCDIGGLPESPFSAAILKARVSKPDFHGNIVYLETGSGDPNMDQVYGEEVDPAPGLDLEVFAPGFRNPFDLVFTTRARVYCTDNGPNAGFGPASTSATTHDPDPSDDDTLNLVIEGDYYGHPNRNRGRYDTRQNVYYDNSSESVPGVFRQGLERFPPSTNGIEEYRAQTFNNALRDELLLQKWNGVTYRIQLSEDGREVLSKSQLNEEINSLDVLSGPGGVILGTDYSNNLLLILEPDDIAAYGLTVYDIFPWRSPSSGGHEFVIGGSGFGDLSNTSVSIGGLVADVTEVSSTRIRGVLPENTPGTKKLLDVVVTVDGVSKPLPKAFRYLVEPGQEHTGEAQVTILPPGWYSTYDPDSFWITNNSRAGQKISRVIFDLSTSIMPDMVFDPDGAAGDPVAKGFEVTTDPGVGVVSHSFESEHDGGYDILEITFNDFDIGETMKFSTDVDPTSIQGAAAPGPGDSGSVSGLELAGSRVLVEFDDGSVYESELYRMPGNPGGSLNAVKHNLPKAPFIEAVDIGKGPATVNDANQTIRITGPAGASVALLHVEAALFLDGVPDGGYDIDPFEANSIINLDEQFGTISPDGYIDIPVTLLDTQTEGGLNYFMAAVKDADGNNGPVSNVLVLELDAGP